MNQFLQTCRAFSQEDEGVTAIEYGLIAALVAVAVIATVYLVGTNLNLTFEKIKTCLTTPASCGT